jgi:asparagine synthase (glutamine-hydrolysing)
MSGICGVFGLPSTTSGDGSLPAMLQHMKHRGPDGFSCYTDPASGGALGHCQLNAFVADSRTAAPGFGTTGTLVVAIDGCVTNRTEIFRETSSAPEAPINEDVQAVLAAYGTYGADCLARLDGPFALALWDRQNRRLLLGRDKLGEKSLYYHVDSTQNTVIFASEIKAILAHPSVHAEMDPENLSLYFAFGYIPGPGTLFKDIYKLLPGERLQVEPGTRPTKSKYWRLPHITGRIDDEAYAVRQLRVLFMEGLEKYVNDCREVAVFLSGGVDSSIIVAGLRELGVPRIATFTIGFDAKVANPEDREDLYYARLVAERFDTEHHEVVIGSGHQPGARLLQVVKQFDDLIMTPNSYSKFLLADAVREAGFNSVLTGSAAAGACGVHRKFLDPHKRARLLKETQECTTDEERYYKLRSRLFDLDEQKAFLRQPSHLGKADILEVLHHYIGEIKSDDFFRLFLFSNLMITSTEKSLKVLDRAGILASVELRSPYLDRALVEFSTQLPSSFDGGQTYVSLKTHLKKAFEHILPAPVLERPVVGYPSYYWNNGELTDYQNRLFSREAVARNGVLDYDVVTRILEEDKHSDAKSAGKHSWALTQFGLWYEIYIKQNPAFAS